MVKSANSEIYELINSVTDESSFVEMLTLVQGKSSLSEPSGEGVVSGFATINDMQVGIFANDFSVMSGSIGKKSAKKISKCIEDSIKMNIPVIGIFDTSGARFGEGIKAMEGYGEIFKNINRAYGVVPTIMVVKGNNFGMTSYLTSCCDCCIAFENARISTASPLILAATTKIDQAKVGTAQVHGAASGLISLIVKDGNELRNKIINVLDYMLEPVIESADDANRVCATLNANSKIDEIISEVFDKDTFTEFKPEYAKEVVVGLARLNGISVGVVANNGDVSLRLTARGARKISDFLTTCISYGLPIVNLVNCEGAEVNLESENDSLIKDISDMLYCYNICSNAKISVIVGKAVGLGYVAFASKRSFDYTIAWENAYIAMLDSKATASLLYADEIAVAKDKAKAEEEFASAYAEENASATVVAESGYLDNVILPSLTRQYLIAAVMMYGAKR
ncbi:MAG: hypothetical protein IKC35_00830 [Clostridia bacterium]|nr:hypothetical protein [Clostridia bacterium]